MVKRQSRQPAYRIPAGISGVGGGLRSMVGQAHQGIVGHRHHAFTRVAVHAAEGIELFQEANLQARLFFQFPPRRDLQLLVQVDKPARQRPATGEWFSLPPDQQHLQVFLVQPEHHTVHRQGGSRIGVSDLCGSMFVNLRFSGSAGDILRVRFGSAQLRRPDAFVGQKLLEFLQLSLKTAGKNREPAPRLGVQVLVVQVK